MGNLKEPPQFVGFGEFELDLRTRELLLNGSKFDLQEQPFQVLALLLEKPGQLVTREELIKRLWPADTFVDFENSLNRVIKRLREALNDSADEPRFIETLPRRGYRFIAAVRDVSSTEQPGKAASTPAAGNGPALEIGQPAARQEVRDERAAEPLDRSSRGVLVVHPWRRRAVFFLVALTLGSLAGWLTYWLLSPAPTLKVVHTRQLTTTAKIETWGGLVSDGSRLYFLEREGDHWNLAQTSVAGGDSQIIAAPFRNTRILDISPDRSTFLVARFAARETLMPLWTWPVQGGAPRRVGDVSAFDAAWCPDGQRIVYSQTDGIYQISADGTNGRKLLSMTGGHIGFFAWSTDGRLLRFTFMTDMPWSGTIFQAHADGTQVQRVPTGSTGMPDDCCGHWSVDGKYFFFDSGRTGSHDIWAFREETGLLRGRSSEPVRLTAGPLNFLRYLPSMNGHTLFALAGNGRNDLVRYDFQSRQFIPFLPNLEIFNLAFSRDGQWMAYVHSRDYALFRTKLDGSEPLVISTAKPHGTPPAWSPDGRQIAVALEELHQPMAIFIMSVDGGTPKRLFSESVNQDDPAWSPDGKLLAFSRFEYVSNPRREVSSIAVFDFATGRASPLAGSVGLGQPSWSPDGRLIAAFTDDAQEVMLLDRDTGKWTELATGGLLAGPPAWSKDGRLLYYQDLLAPNQPIYRIQMSSRKKELVTTCEGYLHSGTHRAGFQGLAPDGSPIVRLDRGDSDVYALDLEFH